MENQLIHFITFLRNIRLNKFRLFFNHKNYLRKVFLEFSVKKNIKAITEKGNSVFIMNACINPFDYPDNSTYNAPKNIHDRYTQVVDGIQSVRAIFPGSDIVYIENSNIPINFENQIKNIVDTYFNFSSNDFLQYSRKIPNKGVPWTMANLLCLQKLQSIKEYSDYHFLNARYQVTLITKDNYNNQTRKQYLHVKMKRHNLSTIYFYFSNVSEFRLLKIFKAAHALSIIGFSVEDIFSVFYLKKQYLKELGVKGTINAIEFCTE